MNPHEFEIVLEFEKHTRDPSRIFYSMGEYIDSFTLLDSSLLSTFDVKIETHLELDDIQAGSIRACIRRVLEAVDDKALKEGNWNQVIGRFLHEAKYLLLKWCDEHDDIEDTKLIEAKTKEINELAERTNLHFIPTYQPFTPQALVISVQSLLNAGKSLQVTDKVIYRASGDEVEVSRTVSFAPEVLEEVLNPKPEHQRQKAVVVIKKPDLLGNSQWEFRLEGHTIRAHILDHDWLTSFKKRQFEIKPGDALRVILDIRYALDGAGHPGEAHYEIVEVLGIVPGTSGEQQYLLE